VITGDYALPVAGLLTSTELEKLTLGVLAKLRPLSLVQRDTVIREIREDYDRGRRHSRSRFSSYSTTLAGAVRRDGVM
jgi:hypothetical protein